jgi:predicted enzyme related to lactoylglutathione lyase
MTWGSDLIVLNIVPKFAKSTLQLSTLKDFGDSYMEIRARESVIMAEDVKKLSAWYRDMFAFKEVLVEEEEYHYRHLRNDASLEIGIADAKQMGVQPGDRKNNTVVLQIEVDDVKALFDYLEAKGGAVTFGPSFDKRGQFWFGGFSDPEGNPIWVVDKDCP